MLTRIPCNAKHWLGKTLVILVIVHSFAKVFPSNPLNVLERPLNLQKFSHLNTRAERFHQRFPPPKFHAIQYLSCRSGCGMLQTVAPLVLSYVNRGIIVRQHFHIHVRRSNSRGIRNRQLCT